MRVTSVQLEIKERTKKDTLLDVLKLLDQTQGSDLVLLPEIWSIGYFSFSRYAEEAESIDGELVQALRNKAQALKAHVFMGSFVEKDGSDLFNTSLLITPQGDVAARYRKIHLFGYQSDEKRILKRGEEIVVVDTPWGKAGLSTCYDLRFPEFYRKMVDAGAEYFLVTSAWPKARLEAWTLFNRARAHENLAFLFSCNCAGTNQGQIYAGHSMFVNPLGQVVAEAGEHSEILSLDVDMGMIATTRKQFSALNDRIFK